MIAFITNGRSPAARRTLNQVARHHSVAICAIVEAETLYGLARKPETKDLHTSVRSLLDVIEVLPWDSAAARAYGTLRAQLARGGRLLSPLDMLIAAHAISVDAILVTHDKAFKHVETLRSTADWATDL